MGAFAGVAQGSHNPARMIVLRYEPPSPNGDVVLGLVGKAITFDTGGISIKPALYMEDMKGDMAGGGAVVEGHRRDRRARAAAAHAGRRRRERELGRRRRVPARRHPHAP